MLRPLVALAVVVTVLPLGGCVRKGLLSDRTSVSLGRADHGALRTPHELPVAGPGYVVPPLWVARGNRYGTDELVNAIQRAAHAVDERYPGGVLGVGDLSARRGGQMPYHRSHENGRDADLIFYAVDDDGRPVPPTSAMPRYNRKLQARPPFEATTVPISPRRFDVKRNWALVAALLDDPSVDVGYLFVSERLRERLIQQARTLGESPELIAKAKYALRQPGGHALPHDDHLHLRIKCSESDRLQGCVDEGYTRLRIRFAPHRRVS